MTWVLCLDSLRHIDRRTNVVTRVSGVVPPTAREGSGPQPFRLVVPDPLVPGLGLTIVWSVHEVGRIRTTRTSCTIGIWQGLDTPDSVWSSRGLLVLHEGVAALEAPTVHAAFGLAAVLSSKPTGTARIVGEPKFGSDHFEVLAGSDVIATATTRSRAVEVARALSRHPAAPMLAPGLAVAADEMLNEYRILPSWLMEHDDRSWAARVESAARVAGTKVRVSGGLDDWTLNGTYRSVDFAATVERGLCRVRLFDQETALSLEDLDGPLSVIGHINRAIDSLGADLLLQLALERSATR